MQESICVVDLRRNYLNRTYVLDFEEIDVHLRVWKTLMALKADGKFFFDNVGDMSYHALQPDTVKCPLDYDFRDFFDLAMDDAN